MVEFITQMKLEQYENILEKINSEFEKNGDLKKRIQKQNDKITVTQLANCKLNQNISLVLVKIFNDIFEIHNVYHSEVSRNNFYKLVQQSCKFYLIELYITKSLQQKINEFNWTLNISVRYNNNCVSRTVPYINKSPIIEIIPVDESVVECLVETYLILKAGDNWLRIKLHTVVLDISYHIHTFKEKTNTENIDRKVLQINKCYRDYEVDNLRKPLLIEYSFKCHIAKENFTKIFLKHSYHQLDVELFAELSCDNKNAFFIQFSTGYNKHTLTYDQYSNSITIKCSICDLYELKSYFVRETSETFQLNKCVFDELKVIHKKLSGRLTAEEVCQDYKKVRKIYMNLSL